jgi:hypothetical protein
MLFKSNRIEAKAANQLLQACLIELQKGYVDAHVQEKVQQDINKRY